MSLVEEYYELNEAEEVSVLWKILQIGLYGFAGIFGLTCGFVLGNLRFKFDDRCYLFTDVEVLFKDRNATKSNINWESDTWCDYCQFSMVSSFMVGIIWGTLFLMCGNGGKSLTGLPQPWRIVWPSLIFNLIYFVIILCTAITIQQGTDFFCGKKNDRKPVPWIESCEPVKILLKSNIQMVLLEIEVVIKASWGCALLWFILFMLSFFRIVFIIDFQLYKICVFKIDDTVQNKKEEVLKITNYEEPKKLYFEDGFDGKIPYEEEIHEDLEAETRKKTKADKRAMRQNFNISARFPYKPNAVFYNTVDLRMLNRDKKRKKSSKVLDETFGTSKTYLGVRLGTSTKTRSISDASEDSRTPAFLAEYSPELDKEEEDEDDASSSSTIHAPDFNEDENDSMSDDEAPVHSFDSDPFLRYKKRI